MYEEKIIPPKKAMPQAQDGTLRKFALRVPEVIYQCSGIIVFGKRIKSLVFSTDLSIIKNVNADAIIAVYGAQRRELIDNHCSQELERLMESRKIYRYQPGQARLHPSDASERYFLGVAAPILAEGDLMGAVMLLLDEQDAPLTEAEQKLVQTVAGFLGRQMEN